MLQVRVHGPGDVRVDDVAEPDPGPADAMVRIVACGICGSDLSYVAMGGLGGREPMCLGHEMAGVVEWIGDDVTGAEVGDRVVVKPGDDEIGRIGNGLPQGGLTPLLHVPLADRDRLHRVPDSLPLDVAALAEPVAVGMHAVEQADVGPASSVCVVGCGPVGLAAVATLVDRGHTGVVAVDPSTTRRRLALDLGADEAVDPTEADLWAALADLHGTKPFSFGPAPATDAYIEATGIDAVLADVIDHAGPGSTVSVVGLHTDPVPTNFVLVLMKELTIRGSIEYPERFADSIDLLSRVEVSRLLTDRFPLADAVEAFDLLRTSKECGKVFVEIDPR